MTGMPTPYCAPSAFSVLMCTGLRRLGSAASRTTSRPVRMLSTSLPFFVTVTSVPGLPEDEQAVSRSATAPRRAASTRAGRGRDVVAPHHVR